MTNLHELTEELLRLSNRLDVAQEKLVEYTQRSARSENDAALARAHALIDQAEGTVQVKEAHALIQTADLRLEAQLDGGMKAASLEAVRNIRQQLSVLQTVANAVKAEAELARTGPTT